ncbi:MAG: DUF1194 domain-containing protein [Alphaproteobacteria bacterium]|nr:DUF1194 domain-containing protein [Alphaproteobacteria bacterium]
MTLRLRALAIAASAALPAAALAAGTIRAVAAEPVDLQLVLAADVSRSVDEREYELQRRGYAAAFRDPRVLRAIRGGVQGRIAVCYFEWSGVDSQKIVVDWTVIGDDEQAGYFSDRLLSEPRPFANRTSIGVAIDYAVAQFERSPAASERRVIDVSGDGTNTNGKPPILARDQAVKQGFTINGLVIQSADPTPWNPEHTHPPGGLLLYYERNVIGGPEAFAMQVEGFESFAEAIANKLIREIAGGRPDRALARYDSGR